MFEDLIKKKPKSINWDFDKYEVSPYCPVCGSEDLTILREQLLSNKLEKDIRCNHCGMEWREEWDKNIDLTLKEVSICGDIYITFYQRFCYGFRAVDVYG